VEGEGYRPRVVVMAEPSTW